jgi:hypothetical protein
MHHLDGYMTCKPDSNHEHPTVTKARLVVARQKPHTEAKTRPNLELLEPNIKYSKVAINSHPF